MLKSDYLNKYVNLVNEFQVADLVRFDSDFFQKSELILDLYPGLIKDDVLYKRLTSRLQQKGFNILFKGILSNHYFGLPDERFRLLVICSKRNTQYSLGDVDINIASKPHKYICPLSLLYGKKACNLENMYYKLSSDLGIGESAAAHLYQDYIVHSESYVFNDVFKKLGVKGSVEKGKWGDGSNKKPLNNQNLRSNISNRDRVHMLLPVNKVTGEHYYHFGVDRTGCTVREIARLSGYSDDFDLSSVSLDDMIFRSNNSLSPFVINNLFDIL